MPTAQNYSPTADFSQDETVNASGRSTVNTTKLDTEFANISTSFNTLNGNLQKLQRDDGKLADYLVEPYNLSDRLRSIVSGGWNPRGNWAANTQYSPRDFVLASGLQFVCIAAHKSGTSFGGDNAFWMAASSAIDASNAATQANASAVSAASSASGASTSASAAANSATTASSAATAANDSANSASNSATSAASSASAAGSSATSAASDAAIAQAARQFNTLLIGSDCDWNGIVLPAGALLKNSDAIPRATYPILLDAIAPLLTGLTITSGSNQVNGVPAFVINALGGAGVKSPQIPIEGAGIPAGAKIASISGSMLVLTVNATAAGTSARIFVHGNGNGTTTFNLPEGRAEFKRGADMARGVDTGRAVGSIQADMIKSHNHQTVVEGYSGSIPSFINPDPTYDGVVMRTDAAGIFSGNTGGTENRPRNVAHIPAIWAYVP